METDRLMDLSSAFAEACQLKDTLLDRAALERTDSAFRSGFESTEHMVLKNLAVRHLRQRYPETELHVEQAVSGRERQRSDRELTDAQGSEGALEGEDAEVRARPDVRCPGRVSVEVETLRSSVLRGSNPFFALEQKLRRKMSVYDADRELWLVVPHDAALLAGPQLQAIVRNLGEGRDQLRVRLAVLDLTTGQPSFIEYREPARVEVRLVGASWREARRPVELQPVTWNDVAGYSDLKARLEDDVLAPLRDPARFAKHRLGSSNGLLLYGLPGCGKSLIGRVLAGEADLVCRRIVPSDLTSSWLGEGTTKTRELFDWALKQSACLLVVDELDAIAPQRREGNMHTDEKRQVNELLAQLDRISGKPVVVVGTTNYFQGIDSAVRRSGRFDVKVPVFPPNEQDRKSIFDYYLGPTRLFGFAGLSDIDTAKLAKLTPLFAPVDIKVAVETVARRALMRAAAEAEPRLEEKALCEFVRTQSRSIQAEDGRAWIEQAAQELGPRDDGLRWLEEEIDRVYPT